METQPVIMVQIADRAWTQAALQSACKLALSLQAPIALVQMVPVQHPLFLGNQLGYLAVAPEDLRLLNDLEVAFANMGIESSLHLFQYVTLTGGIADAADLVAASIVFATCSVFGWAGAVGAGAGVDRGVGSNGRATFESLVTV